MSNRSVLQAVSFTGAALSLVLLLLSLAGTIDAQNMSNDEYRIQAGNFNSIAGKASGGGTTLTFTSGQTAPGLYSKSGVNWKVRAGFQYIYSIIPFSFSISSTEINFGSLNPGEPVTRTNILTVSNGSAFGYQVTASENNELRNLPTGISIPDTTCDSGTCTYTTPATWTSLLTYGFGYRCDDVSGTDCNSDFSDPDYYKPFANLEKNETPQVVMSSANVGRNRKGEVTYKVNISATQAAGQYQNVIMYIATPTI